MTKLNRSHGRSGGGAATDQAGIDAIVAETSPGRSAWLILAVASFAAAVCGGLYGYDTGVISGALLLMTREFGLSHTQQEIVTASILAGAVMGALVTSWSSEYLGRKKTVLVVLFLFALGAILCSLAPSIGALIAARFLLGIAVGGSTQVVPMYISELSPSRYRGTLVTTFNVAIGVGIVLANIVGYYYHDVWSWRRMVSVASIPAGLVFVVMLFMPASPRWIAEKRGLLAAARILERVRHTKPDIHQELTQIERIRQSINPENSGWAGLAQPWARPALVAALGVAFFTQCGGLEMMIYYSPTFLSDAGFGKNAALLASVGVALVYAVVTLVGCFLVDRVGRRRLMLIMIPGSVVSLIGLGLSFMSGSHQGIGALATVAFLLLFMMFNSGGIQICGWLLGAELFPLGMRGPATALHAAMLWGSNLLVTGTALTLVQAVGIGATMWIYAGINFLSFVFVWRVVPETAGLSLEDIEGNLRAGSFSPRRIRKLDASHEAAHGVATMRL